LKPGSPAIDAGEDLGQPFNGLAPDIGAFEAEP
jgi:pectate lyase